MLGSKMIEATTMCHRIIIFITKASTLNPCVKLIVRTIMEISVTAREQPWKQHNLIGHATAISYRCDKHFTRSSKYFSARQGLI